MNKIRKTLSILLLVLILAGIFAGCSKAKNNTFSSQEDLKNAKIGVITGTNYDEVAQNDFPNAERKYFSSVADGLLAIDQDKIDVLFADKTVYTALKWENGKVNSIDEPIVNISNALILAKENYDENLLSELNEFIAKSKNDGTLERLEKKWSADTEPTDHPDYTSLKGTKGTLKIAICDSMKPATYQKGTIYTGYDVDFLTLFAKEYGYKLEIHGMSFDALIPSVSTGKYDIGAAAITITDERKETVTFTEPNFETYGIAVIKNKAGESNTKKTFDDFKNGTIGVQTGTLFDAYADEVFPDGKKQYYSLMTDMILALSQGKIDCYLSEMTYVTAALWDGAKLEILDQIVDESNAGYIFQKGKNTKVREELNAFIHDATENGLLEEIKNKWFGPTEPTEFFDSSTLTGENGTLKVVTSPDLKPLTYIKNGEIVGYDIEVLQYFAKEYGYKIELTGTTFDAVLPGVSSGKYDIGTGGITISEERAQSVDFSESYLTNNIIVVTNSQNTAKEKTSFFKSIKESFNKTFIREDRWKLIVEGIAVTMLISICAAIIGTLFGFGLYMLSRSNIKLIQKTAKLFAKVYSRIVAGTPVVVILMILFYVIFGKIRDLNGIIVAIIGFTLTFGAFVYDHMTVSVGSVDHGQTEAAYALGYSKNQTFFRIIFPQAMKIFLPSYCGQAVELIKATAVVGYIAVNDLTKMGDIIRSNTYEAFFPLIATAVIYFLLTWILSLLLGILKVRFEPKRRKKEDILKGVKTK